MLRIKEGVASAIKTLLQIINQTSTLKTKNTLHVRFWSKFSFHMSGYQCV
jgi:phage tail tape-measure protein